jgi:uncharacterized protein YndB with AHSA1/START domain
MVTASGGAGQATGWVHRPGGFVAVERSIHVDAPPERVFEIVGDVARSPEWAGSGEVRAIRRLTEGPIGVGTRYRSDQNVRGMNYHTTSTITDYEAARRIVWNVGPPDYVRSSWGFTLEPEDGGTRLAHFYDLDLPNNFFARLAYRVFFRLFNRAAQIAGHVETTLRNVKAMAEGKA